MIELLGILAAILEIIGAYLISGKHAGGFYLFIAANISWITYALLHKPFVLGLLLVCPVFFCINIRGIRKWRTCDGSA